MNTPEIIYLIDMGDQIAWCDTDSPSHEDEESVKYVRADLDNLDNERGVKALEFLRDIHEQETTPESPDVDHIFEILFGVKP